VVKCSEVLQCSVGLRNKVPIIIRSHTDNMGLVFIYNFLLSHSFIFNVYMLCSCLKNVFFCLMYFYCYVVLYVYAPAVFSCIYCIFIYSLYIYVFIVYLCIYCIFIYSLYVYVSLRLP
jgi:hypothetical protein